ncbi:sprouty-related, EVH1 domain-containing protein 3 [Tachyglossus aculeatus]|uniref:sprouty-related, EVH1 domain-containing protein 3 n=1 Tax=Tachyglossus aculeatus TaxID=9261 RepID=UPI0018F6F267|nr:sprouty-related, EVH1 domain-containing protein 3 [Tachyglossus aculeatus]
MVRVRAVVMARDDSSGGWLPLRGGGLSHVSVCRGRPAEGGTRRTQYLIRGERLRDQSTILECVLKPDLVYNKVNPIFHHWRLDNSKFGLTFQSPADADAFQRSLQAALAELGRGSLSPSSSSSAQDEAETAEQPATTHTDSESSSNGRQEMRPKPLTIVTSESSSTCYGRSPTSDEYAPPAPSQSRPPPLPFEEEEEEEEETLESTALPPGRDPWRTKGYEDYRRAEAQRTPGPAKPAVCVHFDKGGLGREGQHRPPPRAPKSSPSCRIHAAPISPSKGGSGPGGGLGLGGLGGGQGVEEEEGLGEDDDDDEEEEREGEAGGPGGAAPRCVYCQDVLRGEEKGRGRCQDAPDPVGRCLRQLTCLWCAESLLYHCMSDSEGDYTDPCSCDPGHPQFCARWAALLALALAVPCMCCYLPLRACHWAARRCGCCGGRHKAAR